ncbi:MAG TPA: hypothetical protein PLE19_03385 [Planctomycetota bacterium]|nr:hypothetical protein [Planctomycetota bacterium]HRR79606.1 hypothetical protein [Planctomycetota bacterium]HRT94680.1 hypothetical protein [Planctomycetota bacterium]
MKVADLGAAGVIPQPIVDKLIRLIRRVRWLIVLRGACATAVTAIGTLLAVMAIDATVTLFSLTTRWALTLSAYGATAFVAVWFLVRPLARSLTLAGTARAIETHHPELQERISSAVELLTSQDAPELRGSDQLIRALVMQAADSARGLSPRREVTLRAARPYLAAAAAVAALFAAVFVLWPDQARFLLARASAPFINLPNLRARDLAVTPGDVVILEDQRLQVEVDVPMRNVRGAYFRTVAPDGSETAEEMTPLLAGTGGERRFAFTCPPATKTFRYRIHAGDALSAFYTATVVARPAIEQLSLRYEFPQYTEREPAVVEKADGDIKALPGTVVTLTARTNKPMAAAQMLVNGLPPADPKGQPLVQTTLVAQGEGAPAVLCRFTLGHELAGKWTLQLTDAHTFTSSTAEHAIQVVPDAAPTVAIIKPEAKQLRLPPTAPLPISYTLEDDIGLATAELLIEVDGRGRPPKPIALPPRGKSPTRAVASDTALQLGTMDLRNAKYVTFQLKATDNCPKEFKGPHSGLSDVYRIELDVRAPSFAVAELMSQEKKLKESLERVKKDLQAAKRDSEKLREDLPKQDTPREKDQKRIDDMRKALASADSAARKVAQEMEGGYFDKLGEKVKELADEHIAKAENLAGQTKLAEQAAERGMLARETDRTIDRSIRMVEELMKQVEPVSDVVRKAIEMDEMATREADLAREKLAAEQAAAQANMTPEEWQKAQEALAREMAEMLKDMPGGERAALQAAQQMAANMAAEAREMAREQAALAGQNPQLEKIQAIDKALADIAKQQQQLANDAAAGAASAPQAQPMARAAENIQAGNLPQAVQNQAAAENALNQAAQQMAQGQPPATPPGGDAAQAAPQNAQQVADLAKRQGELRNQTQALMEQRAQLAGEHAQGQMERLRNEQAAVAQQAEALAENVNNVAPQAAPAGDQAARNAGEAAKALQNNQVGEAAKAATEAGNQLGQLAERLENAAAQPFTGQPAPNQGQPAAEAGAQPPGEHGAPAQAQAAQPGAAEGQPSAQGNPKGAGEQGNPPQEAGGAPPAAGNEAQPQGAQNPEPGGAQPPQAAGAQGGQQPNDRGATAQLAQQAAGLAERQQQLAREMQALAGQNPLGQAAAEQGALAERAGDLAQAAAALQQQASQLGAGQGQAADAATQLGRAQAEAQNAANQLANAAAPQGQPAQANPGQGAPNQGAPAQGQAGQGQPGQGAPTPSAASPAQQSAAQAMNAAANALAALGQALGNAAAQASSAEPGTPAAAGTPGQMAQAHQSANQAAAAQSGMAAAQAAGQMSAMASQAAAQAMASGGNLRNQPHPKSMGNPTEGTGTQTTDLSESKLRDLGIKLEDWARLPGELRDQILQAANDLGPDEYRPLIKRYFQEVARRGGIKPAKPEGK